VQVFLRYDVADQLSAAMQSVVHLVVACQAHFRAFAARRAYGHLLQSVQTYQQEATILAQTINSLSLETVSAQRSYRDEERGRKEALALQQRQNLVNQLKQRSIATFQQTPPASVPPAASTLPPPVMHKTDVRLRASDRQSGHIVPVPDRLSAGSGRLKPAVVSLLIATT
jgi:hypothetical protein